MADTLPDYKRRALEKRLSALLEEYAVANQQLNATLSAVDRTRIERQIADLERQIEAARVKLGVNPASDRPEELPPSTSRPSHQVPAPDDARKRILRMPIWIWYFVVVLLGFVLGVVTDLVQLFDLSSCTGLWLATALALISGVAILGFSWLPDQRKLHSQKDRIILVVLILVVTTGLAIYALAKCPPDPESTVVALRTSHDTYVTVWNDDGDKDWELWGWTDHPDVTGPERFDLLCVAGGKAALLSYYDRYVTAMDSHGDWLLRAGRLVTETRGASELFTLFNAQTGKPLPCSEVVKRLMQNDVSVVFLTAHCPIDAQNEANQISLAEQCRHVTARNGKEDDDWWIWADEPGPIRDEQIFTLIKQH